MDYFDNLAEVCTGSEEIFNGKILHVYRDSVRLPNGHSSVRETMRHIGSVGVVPVTEDGKIIIEHQYRYPLNEVILEIPAGKLDSPDEDRLSAAQRELREETGITADEWISLGDYHPAAAYTDERLSMFLARDLHFGPRNLDEDEFLNVEAVPVDTLVQEIMNGRITDGKTQAAILKAALWLRENP